MRLGRLGTYAWVRRPFWGSVGSGRWGWVRLSVWGGLGEVGGFEQEGAEGGTGGV